MGATGAVDVHPPDFYVSIHAPVWVRRNIVHGRLSYTGFQFTHPCGCDVAFRPFNGFAGSFNSRTRVGATCSDYGLPLYDKVSIHAPVWVRRGTVAYHTDSVAVSIHAPVWVRLALDESDMVRLWVSIHAPVWVRHPYRFSRDSLFRFQFTHPCGCDTFNHNPYRNSRSFNSRTRVGATCRQPV